MSLPGDCRLARIATVCYVFKKNNTKFIGYAAAPSGRAARRTPKGRRMDNTLLEKAVAFHGHLCPGLVIGLRAVEAVLQEPVLGKAPYGTLVCVTENDACGVDAIQCLLGCSAGKGNLILRPVAKHAYAFFDRNSGTALRLCLQKQKDPDQNREQWQQALLTLPLEALFSLSVPAYAVPEPPRLFPTVVCEICGEGAAEHAIRLENGKKVCLDCQQTYARRW